MNWVYKGKEVTKLSDLGENVIGFIYRLTYADSKLYIGKKTAASIITKTARKDGSKREGHIKFTKKRKKAAVEHTALALPDGSKREGHKEFYTIYSKRQSVRKERYVVDVESKVTETLRLESDWLTYTGSNHYTSPVVAKEILEVIETSNTDLTYAEVALLIRYNAIVDDTYVNEQILNSFYRGRVTFTL